MKKPIARPYCQGSRRPSHLKLLHIKLIGTFPTIVVDLAGGEPVSAVVITADPESGKPCLLSVRVGPNTPDPGATLLFAK